MNNDACISCEEDECYKFMRDNTHDPGMKCCICDPDEYCCEFCKSMM